MKQLIILFALLAASSANAQSRLSKSEISINGFRCPSIGAEYRYRPVSIHAGYYLTAFSGETNNFVKIGLTGWFLPIGKRENPSSFFAGVSYLRGLDHDYEDKNASAPKPAFDG